MENEKDFVSITLMAGGIIQTMKTGKYPCCLIFRSNKYFKRWRRNITGEKRKGYLKYNGEIVYRYDYPVENSCAIYDAKGNKVEVSMDEIMVD
jgi:hypothetical protein